MILFSFITGKRSSWRWVHASNWINSCVYSLHDMSRKSRIRLVMHKALSIIELSHYCLIRSMKIGWLITFYYDFIVTLATTRLVSPCQKKIKQIKTKTCFTVSILDQYILSASIQSTIITWTNPGIFRTASSVNISGYTMI